MSILVWRMVIGNPIGHIYIFPMNNSSTNNIKNKISNLVLRLPNKFISYLLVISIIIYRLYQKLDH